jgi:Response regulators consisting of a CheY-like receiver domain and a winged-helix DNA-binding domain
MDNYKILIVEDERQMAMFIEMELTHEGYKVDIAYDGRGGLKKVENEDYDLILLDVMLPGLNGIEVCKKIRQFSKIPIIILTAKGEVPDKVLGLDAGANDYLSKPFAIEELLARIRVYTRDKKIIRKAGEIKVKDVVMDNQTHQVWRAGKKIELTKKEYDLLEMLLINKNIVLTREKIIEKVITTIRGVGYVIKDN